MKINEAVMIILKYFFEKLRRNKKVTTFFDELFLGETTVF